MDTTLTFSDGEVIGEQELFALVQKRRKAAEAKIIEDRGVKEGGDINEASVVKDPDVK